MLDLYGFRIEQPRYISPAEAFEEFIVSCPQPSPKENTSPPDYGADCAPSFSPPHYTPPRPGIRREVDGYAMQSCLYTPTYFWLENGQQFWFYPTFMGRRSVAGYRWVYSEWLYTGFGFDMIENFTCSH